MDPACPKRQVGKHQAGILQPGFTRCRKLSFFAALGCQIPAKKICIFPTGRASNWASPQPKQQPRWRTWLQDQGCRAEGQMETFPSESCTISSLCTQYVHVDIYIYMYKWYVCKYFPILYLYLLYMFAGIGIITITYHCSEWNCAIYLLMTPTFPLLLPQWRSAMPGLGQKPNHSTVGLIWVWFFAKHRYLGATWGHDIVTPLSCMLHFFLPPEERQRHGWHV